jgi:phosphate transport system substrate-binding protein
VARNSLPGLRSRRRLAVAGVALCAAGLLSLAALPALAAPASPSPSPAPTGPRLSATPHATLVDRQFVKVAWRGFRPYSLLYLRQCSGAPKTMGDCVPAIVNAISDGTGGGEVYDQVHEGHLGAGVVCDYFHPCTIGIFPKASDISSAVFTPIRFEFPLSSCPRSGLASLTGAGSSSANRAVQHWAATVCRKPHLLSVTYTLQNSVAGLQGFVSGATDFSGTGMPLSDAQRATLLSLHRTYAYVPVTLSGLVFGFNIHDRRTGKQITDLRLTPDLLAKLFTGQILNWQDPEIEALNPGVAFPPLVRAVGRADGCNQTFQLTSWFDSVARKAYEAGGEGYQHGPTAIFPSTGLGDVNLQTGADAAAREVAAPSIDIDPLTYGYIGWMDSSYAALYGLPTVSVENTAGEFVKATTDSLFAAESDMRTNPDGMTRTPDYRTDDPRAYPIPIVTYLLVPTNKIPGEKVAPLRAWLRYVMGDGQQNLAAGYAPLPQDLVGLGSLALAEMPKPPPSPSPTPTGPPTPTPTTSISPFPTSVPPPPVPPPVVPSGSPTPSVSPSSTGASPSPAPIASPSPSLVAIALEPTSAGRARPVLVTLLVVGVLSLLLGPALLLRARRPERLPAAPGPGPGPAPGPAVGRAAGRLASLIPGRRRRRSS